MKRETNNTFGGGLNYDLNPIVTPNDVLIDAENATYLTFDGEEVVLQNDSGNVKILHEEGAVHLTEGFHPIGIKEYGGVLYIASGKVLRESDIKEVKNNSIHQKGDIVYRVSNGRYYKCLWDNTLGFNISDISYFQDLGESLEDIQKEFNEFELGTYPAPHMTTEDSTYTVEENVIADCLTYKQIHNKIFQAGSYIEFINGVTLKNYPGSNKTWNGRYENDRLFTYKLFLKTDHGFIDLTESIWSQFEEWNTAGYNHWMEAVGFKYYCPINLKGYLYLYVDIKEPNITVSHYNTEIAGDEATLYFRYVSNTDYNKDQWTIGVGANIITDIENYHSPVITFTNNTDNTFKIEISKKKGTIPFNTLVKVNISANNDILTNIAEFHPCRDRVMGLYRQTQTILVSSELKKISFEVLDYICEDSHAIVSKIGLLKDGDPWIKSNKRCVLNLKDRPINSNKEISLGDYEYSISDSLIKQSLELTQQGVSSLEKYLIEKTFDTFSIFMQSSECYLQEIELNISRYIPIDPLKYTINPNFGEVLIFQNEKHPNKAVSTNNNDSTDSLKFLIDITKNFTLIINFNGYKYFKKSFSIEDFEEKADKENHSYGYIIQDEKKEYFINFVLILDYSLFKAVVVNDGVLHIISPIYYRWDRNKYLQGHQWVPIPFKIKDILEDMDILLNNSFSFTVSGGGTDESYFPMVIDNIIGNIDWGSEDSFSLYSISYFSLIFGIRDSANYEEVLENSSILKKYINTEDERKVYIKYVEGSPNDIGFILLGKTLETTNQNYIDNYVYNKKYNSDGLSIDWDSKGGVTGGWEDIK